MFTRHLMAAMMKARTRSLVEAVGCLLWAACPDPGACLRATADSVAQYAEYLDRAQRDGELEGAEADGAF